MFLRLIKICLSVGQLLEKDYAVVFKDKTCEVFDSTGIKLMSIKMKGKSFSANIQTDLAYSSAAKVGTWEKAKIVEKVKKKKSCAFKGRQGSVAVNGPVGRSMRIEERPRGKLPNLLAGMILRSRQPRNLSRRKTRMPVMKK